MPLIHVWNFKTNSPTYDNPRRWFLDHVGKACVDVKELGLKDDSDVTVNFAGYTLYRNKNQEGPLIIIVDLLYERPERTLEIKKMLAEAIGEAARRHAHGGQKVEVFVRMFDPEREASWFSKD